MYNLRDIGRFREKYGKKKLVLDTNLFILFLVGCIGEKLLKKCASTEKYSKKDFELLIQILKYFESEIIITPHVLAEISNLSKRDIKDDISYFFKIAVDKLKSCKEESIPLERLLGIKVDILARFGFSDISLIEVAKSLNAVILTDDMRLCVHVEQSAMPIIGFRRICANEMTN